MNSNPTQDKTRRRPNLFRALGDQDVPRIVVVDGNEFQLEKSIKHDSWAATAIYRNKHARIVCKFNRIQHIFLIPCRWVGRWLARRESAMYKRLHDVPNIAAGFSCVESDGKRLDHAAAHEYIEGHPLSWHDRVDEDFIEKLRATLLQLHQKNIAYVDLNKWENIIVDESGNPWLIDFQISVKLPAYWPFGQLLKLLQASDLYHLSKHASRIRPDLYPEYTICRPWWIRVHRKFANPLRSLRRRLLVASGIRSGKGKPQSEEFVEEGLREIGGKETPILRLYQVLKSPEYAEYATADGKHFVQQVFVDLIGRKPGHELEHQMVERLKAYTHHDQIVWLLKSRLFNVVTERWSQRLIEQKIETIKIKIGSFQVNQRSAA